MYQMLMTPPNFSHFFMPPAPVFFPPVINQYQPPSQTAKEIEGLIYEIEDEFDKAIDTAVKEFEEVAATVSNDFFDTIELDDDSYAPVAYIRRDRHDSAEDANYEEIEYETGGFPVKKEGVTIIPFINGTPLGPNCDGWAKSFKPHLDGIRIVAESFGVLLEEQLKDPAHNFFPTSDKKKEK
jgi:hypothetical protein